MLAAWRLLLDSQMNSDKPEGTFPTPPGNSSTSRRVQGACEGCRETLQSQPREGLSAFPEGQVGHSTTGLVHKGSAGAVHSLRGALPWGLGRGGRRREGVGGGKTPLGPDSE